MKIQKKQAIGENLLYVMVWTAIILVPVLNSQMMSEMHVNLENVLTAWRYIAPYLIIFLIHNAIIAPRYMLRRKYGKYLASNLALITSRTTSSNKTIPKRSTPTAKRRSPIWRCTGTWCWDSL